MLTQQSTKCRKTHAIPGPYLGTFTWYQGNMCEYETMQTRQTDESQSMMLQMSHTKQSHKAITQMNCTR